MATTPTHFTKRDGGLWEWWDNSEVHEHDFDKFYPDSPPKFVKINKKEVHAFAFGFSPQGQPISRWDCVSGWTRKDGEPVG